MENIDSKIANLKKEIADLETRKKNLETDPITNSFSGKLAEYLHDKFCRTNHIDGCSWHYEINHSGKIDWSCYAHGNYLTSAMELIKFFKANGYREG